MAEKIKTHWKKLHNPNFLGAYSLMQGDKSIEMTVTIQNVVVDKVAGEDGKKEDCMIARIVNNKPFVLNPTNAKIITKLYGPFIEDWAGKQIILHVKKIKAFGETVDALRVKDEKPKGKELPDLNPQHEKWSGAVTAITNGGTTLEKILKAYNVSDDNKSLLFAPLEAEITALLQSKGDSLPEAVEDNVASLLQIKEYPKYFEILSQLKEA